MTVGMSVSEMLNKDMTFSSFKVKRFHANIVIDINEANDKILSQFNFHEHVEFVLMLGLQMFSISNSA